MRRNMFIMMATLLMLPSQYSYAQNWVRIARSAFRRTPTTVTREIRTRIGVFELGHQVGLHQRPDVLEMRSDKQYVYWTLERKIARQSIRHPRKLYGPYNYLRAISSVSREHKELVARDGYWDWRRINEVDGYNGVHHLISKSTIELLYADLKEQGIKVSLKDMQNNAPAIFHPMHGDPRFTKIFHNAEQQFYDYKRFGMKVTVISLLERIDEINMALDLPLMKETYMTGILAETELWCKTYHLQF